MDTAVATATTPGLATGYTVALRDCPGLSALARMQAEIRYCQALERRLGSAQAVATTLRAVIASHQDGAPGADADASDALAMRWRLANMAAHRLGLDGLPQAPSAAFEVSLD